MPIKIPDNVMQRPLNPGTGDAGPNVTARFGNVQEQFVGQPDAVKGMFGVANPNAGLENQAAAQAIGQVANTVEYVANEYDKQKGSADLSRAKLMELEWKKETYNIRDRLSKDIDYLNKSPDEQTRIYNLERDTAIDAIRQRTDITHREVVKQADFALKAFQDNDAMDYLDRVVKPRNVENHKLTDAKTDEGYLATVVANQAPEVVKEAAINGVQRYSSPEAVVLYGPAGAKKMLDNYIKNLINVTGKGFMESLKDSPIGSKIDVKGLIGEDSLKNGAVGALLQDQIFRANNILAQIPMDESDRQAASVTLNKAITKYAEDSVKDHNTMFKQAEIERLDGIENKVNTYKFQATIGASNGSLSRAENTKQFTLLTEEYKDQPKVLVKILGAYEHVNNKFDELERERARAARDARRDQLIAGLRADNGVNISGGSADKLWQKNKMLDAFFKGGNVLSKDHVADINRMGAVPTSVIGSIQSDLQSNDPATQKRAVANLMAIKSYSPKTQQALYKELPDGYASVLTRIESGQSPRDALAFQNRDRVDPDLEKKYRSEATNKKNRSGLDDALKKAGFDPSKMAPSLVAEAEEMWKDAFVQEKGDPAGAAATLAQSVSKNRNWGVSKYTDKFENLPLTNFTGSKEVADDLIDQRYPDAKGKERMPVFDGIKYINGQQRYTYVVKVRDKDTGFLTRLDDGGEPFYVTKDQVGAALDKRNEVELNKQLAKAAELKENQRYWQNKTPNPITAGKAPKPTNKE